MHRVKNVLKTWIPLAVVITLLSGMMYICVQQVLRISANDPQIQLAQDVASELGQGVAPESVVPAYKVEIASSLAPYVAVFDDSGKALASSGLLHNQMPALPAGVYEYVRQHGEDRITWQPESGVRSAVVVTRYGGAKPGFVMAGRSLYEVERREDNLQQLIGLGWAGTLFAGLLVVGFCQAMFSNGDNRRDPK